MARRGAERIVTAIVPSGHNEPAAPLCAACGAPEHPVMCRDCMRESQDDVAADGFSDPDQYAHDLGLAVDDDLDGW